MTKAKIRWCTCRVENILTLGKLLSLWLCFLHHSFLFLISQTSYRTYKINSSYELARPVMGTIFLVIDNFMSTTTSFADYYHPTASSLPLHTTEKIVHEGKTLQTEISSGCSRSVQQLGGM